MAQTYSTYEAKARFSELLRKVRAGQRLVISHRGEPIAELRPLTRPKTLADSLEQLEQAGVLVPSSEGGSRFRPALKRRGALARFLASRK